MADVIDAIYRSNDKLAASLVRPDNAGYIDKYGYSVLIIACIHGCRRTALVLIATRKSNPGYIDIYGNTALIYACSYENIYGYRNMEEVAVALIYTGQSQPFYVNTRGDTALQLARDNKQISVITLLQNYVPKQNNSANALIAPDQPKPEQVNDICETAQSNNIANAFIAPCQSKPEQVNDIGETAQTDAQCNNATDIIDAIYRSDDNLAASLVRPDNAGYIDKFGYSILIIACIYRCRRTALALIATGKSNPGYMRNNNTSALLCICCYSNMQDVAVALIATGQSQPFHVTDHGYTALKFARENKLTEVIALLENYDILDRVCTDQKNVANALIAPVQTKLEQVNDLGKTVQMDTPCNNVTDIILLLCHYYWRSACILVCIMLITYMY